MSILLIRLSFAAIFKVLSKLELWQLAQINQLARLVKTSTPSRAMSFLTDSDRTFLIFLGDGNSICWLG